MIFRGKVAAKEAVMAVTVSGISEITARSVAKNLLYVIDYRANVGGIEATNSSSIKLHS